MKIASAVVLLTKHFFSATRNTGFKMEIMISGSFLPYFFSYSIRKTLTTARTVCVHNDFQSLCDDKRIKIKKKSTNKPNSAGKNLTLSVICMLLLLVLSLLKYKK